MGADVALKPFGINDVVPDVQVTSSIGANAMKDVGC